MMILSLSLLLISQRPDPGIAKESCRKSDFVITDFEITLSGITNCDFKAYFSMSIVWTLERVTWIINSLHARKVVALAPIRQATSSHIPKK